MDRCPDWYLLPSGADIVVGYLNQHRAQCIERSSYFSPHRRAGQAHIPEPPRVQWFICQECRMRVREVSMRHTDRGEHQNVHMDSERLRNQRITDEELQRIAENEARIQRNWENPYGDLDRYEYLDFSAVPFTQPRSSGMTGEELHHVVEVPYGKSTKKVECICGNDLEEGDKVKFLPCAHVFHTECIDKWLGQKAICPFDRYSVS